MDVLGRKFSLIDPPLADRSHTSWIFDHKSGTLFTADGMGNYHTPEQCQRTYAGLEDGIRFEDIYGFHRDSLVWLRYVDPKKLGGKLRTILDQHQPSLLAPIHGNPIERNHLDEYMNKLIRSVEKISGNYTVLSG